MDVQMDPCMQTSRIRHALSSVQLFIERCFMNLETKVAPSVFDPKHRKQWEWMKRYRVWEANRKVFLWPENWVEPELRGGQSPFFKEAMSELLQSDITEDRAATALLNYLSKLEEVAKLEPCGIRFVEGDKGTADDIAHVVARTAGADRKYFYRRQEAGVWSPWEQIKLDIEDNPVIPVVWKDRLFLFWLKILKQAPLDPPEPPPGDELGKIKPSDMVPKEVPKVTVQAVLCWSEYYNGKWQPTKTSDVNRPLWLPSELHQPSFLIEFPVTGEGSFDRSILRLGITNGSADDLFIYISPYMSRYAAPAPSGDVPDYTLVYPAFRLFNTHSLPTVDRVSLWVTNIDVATIDTALDIDTPSEILEITHGKAGTPSASVTHDVLHNKNRMVDHAIIPRHHLANEWNAPFFYWDSHHAFYVTTKKEKVPIQDQRSYYEATDSTMSMSIKPLTIAKYEPGGPGPYEVGPNGINILSAMKGFISEDAYIKKGLLMTSTVHINGTEIGPAGRVAYSIQEQ